MSQVNISFQFIIVIFSDSYSFSQKTLCICRDNVIKRIVPFLNSEWFPLLDRYFTVPVTIGGP